MQITTKVAALLEAGKKIETSFALLESIDVPPKQKFTLNLVS